MSRSLGSCRHIPEGRGAGASSSCRRASRNFPDGASAMAPPRITRSSLRQHRLRHAPMGLRRFSRGAGDRSVVRLARCGGSQCAGNVLLKHQSRPWRENKSDTLVASPVVASPVSVRRLCRNINNHRTNTRPRSRSGATSPTGTTGNWPTTSASRSPLWTHGPGNSAFPSAAGGPGRRNSASGNGWRRTIPTSRSPSSSGAASPRCVSRPAGWASR